MNLAVHSSVWVAVLAAIVSADRQEDNTIHITGLVQVIVGSPGDGTTQEGLEVPTAEQCTGEDRFCVGTGDSCNGTIKMLHSSCNDHCTCCLPGGFSMPHGKFYKIFHDVGRTWDEAKAKCTEEGLMMAAKPSDAAALRKYLLDTYGRSDVWLDARGDGSTYVWQSDQTYLSNNSPLWHPDIGPNRSGGGVSTDHCLYILTQKSAWREYPDSPYGSDPCSYTSSRHPSYALCEAKMQ